MENLRHLDFVETAGERNFTLRRTICRIIDTPIVANARLEYLDLATQKGDVMRKLRRSSNIGFLEAIHISDLTRREHINLVESFMNNRGLFSNLIRRRSAQVINKCLKTIFYYIVDNKDFLTHVLYRIGFLFELDKIVKRFDDANEYRTQNIKILDKLLLQHSSCHFCALSYIRLLYPSPSFVNAFLCDLNRTEVLEYFLKMTYEAGVDIWRPDFLAEYTRDPILYFMSAQKYTLVHTLIDYGYTIRLVKPEDEVNLISGFFRHHVAIGRSFSQFQASFRREPVKTTMILYALGHCALPRADGFLSAYERLHKSLGLPHYPTSYIRAFLRNILDENRFHNMIENRCYAYRRCGFEKYPECTPRSLLDLATCAYRNVLKRLPCELPTAIGQLEFPDHLKDLVALKP